MTSEKYRRKEREQHSGCAHARILACVVGALGIFSPAIVMAEDAGEWDPAQGRAILELRPRYNRIDESNKPERTEGYTYRAVAGWRPAPWNGLRLTAEAIHTGHIGPKEFNDDGALFSTSPYPLLPDPRYTGVNQAHVEYTGIEGLRLRAGRQRVRMDNQRWVSDNDFRQIPQLFDGVEVRATPLPDTELLASRFWRVRGTSGTTSDLKLTLVHAAWNPFPGHSIGAYAYFHDQPANGAFTGFANSSYRVAGGRVEGAFQGGALEFPYVLEAAQQRPYAGGDARIDVRYWRVGGGATWKDLTARYDEEAKGSNRGRYGLQMPLTDFYAFNGWTLHFFNTPFQGLRDRWLTLRARLYAPLDLVFYAEGHRFRSDFGNLDFGKETDAGLSWSLTGGVAVRVQHARYEPGSGQVAPSIHKTWVTISYTY